MASNNTIEKNNLSKKKSTVTEVVGRFLAPYRLQYDLFLLFIPIILFFVIFKYKPMYGVLIAFKDFKLVKGFSGSEWVGFANFRKVFQSPSFWEVFRNSIEISALKIVFGFPAPIILSLLLNEVQNLRYKKLVQTISYLPHFLSWVVLAGIFIQFLSPSTGLVNQILSFFGIRPIYFLGNPKWFRFTLVTTDIWRNIGWNSIIYIASIASIDVQMYEAAIVDGATRWEQVRYITLPSLAPVITVSLILTTGGILNAGFDQVFNLYNEAVYSVGDIIDTYVYRKGLAGGDYSFGSTVGLFQNVISISMLLLTNTITKKLGDGAGSLW